MTKLGFWSTICVVSGLAAPRAFADQCEWVEPAQATRAVAVLKHGAEYLEYCEPCGDTQPTKVGKVDSATKRVVDPKGGSVEVAIDGTPVDLAYIFVKAGKTYDNLARLAGCPTSGVSKSITYPVTPSKSILAPWYGRYSPASGNTQIILKEDPHSNSIATTITLISDEWGDQRGELTGYLHTDTDVPTFVTPFKGCALTFTLKNDELAVGDNKKCGDLMSGVVGAYKKVSKVR